MMKNKGFTAVELILALFVMGCIFAGSLIYANGKTRQGDGLSVANQALDYTGATTRYIKTHYTLYEELLTVNGQSNGLVATVPMSILKSEGFVNNAYAETNLLNQYPCLVITYGNNQIEGFIYYRDNGNSKQLKPDQLHAGLEHIGGMIGLYESGMVGGAGNGWSLSASDAANLFMQQGSADPSQGVNPATYQCLGSNIANNSYVINLASQLMLNNRLPNDDSLHEYPDTQNQIDNSQNTNTMLSNLNMDYTNPDPPDGKPARSQSNIIFQLNENCVMDPNQPATMQDYDPVPDGSKIENSYKPNNLGCRNRQLGLSESTDINNNATIIVTGFQKGGEANQYDAYNQANPNSQQQQPYVGELAANSIQPTAKVAVGKICSKLELGKMAQQYNSGDPNDINNLYISQVQCMVHPLCPEVTGGICYMPVSTVTLQLKTQQSSYSSISKLCPVGTFVSAVDHDNSAITPSPCCGNNDPVFGSAGYCCHIDGCEKGGGSCSTVQYTDPLSGYALYGAELFQGIVTTPSRWYQGCPTVHTGCNEGWGQVSDTYIVVRSITCTNDITQIALPIQQ